LKDLASQGTDILTLGQYLQPTREHLPIVRYLHPDEFAEFKIASGPLEESKLIVTGPLFPHAREKSKSRIVMWRSTNASI